ncbi:hypothetical protein [Sphingobium sp. B2]|uniref:hypothetical protein n=1 Tax=Sphingobium sp. B2 TaxID=2583228 RepID=UPI0011AAFC52|nr:hypothetical protein [Sphingobium sp. B2]
MNETLHDCAGVLAEAGFSTRFAEIPADDRLATLETLAFEDATILGFVVAYETPAQLVASWKIDRDRVAMRHRDALQAARQKAWNAYLVLISRGAADFAESLALGQIEEDLEAMRKITKAGVVGAGGARAALLPLLPFRAAPSLDPIDMRLEIQSRSTELDADIVAAFLSGAEEGVVMQLLEDRA